MADEAKIGSDWSDGELDLIVADYFAMLRAEQDGDPYAKAAHRRALMEQIGRTKRSVEFKHMNISAVLRELGIPWIDGYKPKTHYQKGAILAAIDRYLSDRPQALEFRLPHTSGLSANVDPFIEAPPTLSEAQSPRLEALERLVRKFDPVERDFRNRRLGKAGEEFVFEFERRRLTSQDRSDLARKVRWVSQEDGDGAGFDILSFDHSGAERLIEVKTTCGGNTTPFYLTRNEQHLSMERPGAFRLYRLYGFSRAPRLFELVPPLSASVRLDPLVFTASFR
jgi:hypothetical protein